MPLRGPAHEVCLHSFVLLFILAPLPGVPSPHLVELTSLFKALVSCYQHCVALLFTQNGLGASPWLPPNPLFPSVMTRVNIISLTNHTVNP